LFQPWPLPLEPLLPQPLRQELLPVQPLEQQQVLLVLVPLRVRARAVARLARVVVHELRHRVHQVVQPLTLLADHRAVRRQAHLVVRRQAHLVVQRRLAKVARAKAATCKRSTSNTTNMKSKTNVGATS
jgi:hypothetical protein